MKLNRAVVVLVLALLAGLAAVVLAARWLNQQNSDASRLVVASRDVNLGMPLDVTSLTTVPWPNAVLPDGGYHDPKELEGRVLKTSLTRGEPILESKLAPKGSKGGLSAVIAEGKRAITVKVNEVIGVAGFALPGSFVDVMVHTTLDEGDRRNKGNAVSKIVLERILVLAIAQEASRDETKPKVVSAVTLEVSPEQAELLDVARSVGNLSLVLRNQIDNQPINSAGMGKADLFGAEPAPAPPVASPPAPVVAVARPAPVVAVARPAPVRRPVATAAAPVKPAPPKDETSKVEVIRGVARSSVDL